MSAPNREYEDVVPERQRRLADHLGIKEAIFYAGRRATESLPDDPGVVQYGGNGNGRSHVAEQQGTDSEASPTDGDE